MTYPEQKRIYETALERFGLENQIIVCIEELSELTKELTKVLRGKGNDEHLAEEIADARITIGQMTEAFDLGGEVLEIEEQKLKRLEGML